MARRRFRLNSLSRYTKESDRLVLDSYSAGCGGIVLRWRDPNEGMPIRFNLAATSMTELFLDGQPIKRATIMAPGEHVMAIRCYPYSEGHYFSGDSPRRAIAMTFTPHYPNSDYRTAPISGFGSSTSWRYETTANPGDPVEGEIPQWATVSYDDTNWSPMEETEAMTREENWALYNITNRGGVPLLLPEANEIRIRYHFTWERIE